MARATEKQILRITGSLGLRWRAKFLRRLGIELAARRQIPDSLDELIALPGVGPYAASAYLSFHRGRRGVLLDSNIVRFYGRLLGLPTGPETRRTPLFKDIANTATPSLNVRDYNYAILDFTRTVCAPTPCCTECPLRRRCAYGRSALASRKTAG